MEHIAFFKMHGIGNDFVIIDAREDKVDFSRSDIIAMGNRQTGVGFDQLIIMDPSNIADTKMRVYNNDGSESGMCGNAARCVASLILEDNESETMTIETPLGVLSGSYPSEEIADNWQIDDEERNAIVSIEMGTPRLGWKDIPLASKQDTMHVEINSGELQDAVAVNIGNPHLVYFVDNIVDVDLHKLGPILEHDKMLPEQANISIVQQDDASNLQMRVWERGTGETLACGSGACAVLVAAVMRDLVHDSAFIHLPGGMLHVSWENQGKIVMTGPASFVFSGII